MIAVIQSAFTVVVTLKTLLALALILGLVGVTPFDAIFDVQKLRAITGE